MALLLLLLSLFAFPAAADPLYHICGPIENFTGYSNDTFTSIIKHLVSTLSSNAPATGFARYTTTDIIPKLHSFVLCRGDVSADTCSSCITTAFSDIQILCPNRNSASIWYDYCQFSYSNPPDNLLVPNVEENIKLLMFNAMNVSSNRLSRFQVQSNALICNISDLAMRNTSQNFATGEIALTANDTIYGLVQCSKDLSVGDCRACLQGAVEAINIYPLRGKRGGRTIGTWCSMRYELYKFYDDTSMFQLSPHEARPITNGSVPKTILPQSVNLSHGGKKSTIRRKVTIFLSLGILLLISTIAYLIWVMKRSKGTRKLQTGQTLSIQGIDIASRLKIRERNLEFLFISLSSIVEATNNFSTTTKLGQGGFGSVYKGQLQEGESIAVKRLDAVSSQGLEEFMNEIMLIVKLQHQNLVKLLGCCVEGDEKLLVYEYMPNNSLEYHLFDPVRKEQLDWSKRYSIIEGIAQGLLYLHKYSRVQIIHRDLKASNILLDLDMKPKISDFGMARIFDANTAQANTNRIVGTYGYMSPEYAMEGIFSIKSDVFSFGVLMLEIISGKRNTTFHKFGKALNLLAYAWDLWKNGYLLDFVDSILGDKVIKQEVLNCIIVALMCVQENAIDRPLVSEIIAMLGSENTTLLDPKKPAFVTIENERASKLSSQFATQSDLTFTILEGR